MVAPDGGIEANTGQGILANHAYGILGVQQLDSGVRLLRVRNPWGEGEWKGAWSDNAPEWTPEILKTLNYQFAEDGTFWISFDDFVQQYNRFYTLRLHGSDRWRHAFVKGEWKGLTAGGCGNFPSWKYNPQFGFELDSQMDVFISLGQKDTRMDGVMLSPINIGFMILRAQG